jgi:hypothetical protein
VLCDVPVTAGRVRVAFALVARRASARRRTHHCFGDGAVLGGVRENVAYCEGKVKRARRSSRSLAVAPGRLAFPPETLNQFGRRGYIFNETDAQSCEQRAFLHRSLKFSTG